ncbi:hypothetical protein HYH03_010210 [Edaphochlamys debaryana]|uniref:Uncharacterized protein n=1 Tax=Edaphochlamys debaryana TaxID=47281 RepID=A0A835XXG0_9CHLO|nr:hypothetical protein HYH03_010210 [Edaphochlamys debaryana]|eukprot:KAG2491422.1 hypothetical protein HYH03_010210 [Edaphochlamys debaryana]
MEDQGAVESLASSVLDHPLVVARIASFLPPPFVSLQLRLVSKELSEQLDQYDTINVAKGMSGEDCIAALAVARSELTLRQRQRILGAAAVYGDADALERVAEAAGCAPVHATMAAAARAGQLACCQRLVEMGCPEGGGLEAAASGGHREVCEWFLSRGASPYMGAAVAAAASGGHVALMDMPYSRLPQQTDKARVLQAVAHGCDKDTLQRIGGRSPTRDWQDKLTWLQGASAAPPDSAAVCEAAARCPGAEAVARLQWLQQRGYPVTRSHAHPDCAVIQVGAISAAAASGNMEAFTRLREQGAPLPGRPVTVKLEGDANAAKSLRDVLPGLNVAGCPVYYFPTALHAAQRRDRKGIAWLVERFPAQPPPGMAPADYSGVLKQAASAGSVQLMAWVQGWGGVLHPGVWEGAVKSVCEAALLWLRDNGCPAPSVALYQDVFTLHALLYLKLLPNCRTRSAAYAAIRPCAWRETGCPPLPNLKLLLKHAFLAEGLWDDAHVLVASLPIREARKALFEWLRQEWAQGA